MNVILLAFIKYEHDGLHAKLRVPFTLPVINRISALMNVRKNEISFLNKAWPTHNLSAI